MTDERVPGGKKDPLRFFEAIPGTDRTDINNAISAISAGSAYEQVRGLLAEHGHPATSHPLSEKMLAEMESFNQRWSERPIPPLVSAGRKLVDQSGPVGLNRLLRLPAVEELGEEPCSKPAEDDEGVEHAAAADIESPPEVEEESELTDDADQSSTTEEPEAEELNRESDEDRAATDPPTARVAAAQAAFAALNPLEAELFLSRTGLVEATWAEEMRTRAHERALSTLNDYEQGAHELRQQLAAERAEAAAAAQDAASRNEALSLKVTALTGRIEALTAELSAARLSAADSDDDSGGGAGCELSKPHDELEPVGDGETVVQCEDEPTSSAGTDDVGDFQDVAENESGASEEDGMARRLARLAQGDSASWADQDFGD